MVMYFANEIKLESNRLSYCLFESNWIDELKLGGFITIVSEVLKQPHELIICKIYPMDLEAFTAVSLKTENFANYFVQRFRFLLSFICRF